MTYKEPDFKSLDDKRHWDKLNHILAARLKTFGANYPDSDIVVTFPEKETKQGLSYHYKVEGTDKELIKKVEAIILDQFQPPTYFKK